MTMDESSVEQVKNALDEETILVTIMYGNNEVGTDSTDS